MRRPSVVTVISMWLSLAPGYFERHNRRAAFQERDHQDAHHVEERMFLFRRFGHVGRNGTDQSVTQQNSQERSYQGGCHFVSDFFRRAAESSHGDDDAQHCGHDPQAGQGIAHGAERGRGRCGIVMVNFHVEVEHLVEVEGIDTGDGMRSESQTKSQT